MIISTKYTHADLLAMPDDGKRREIIEGELFVTPSPLDIHQKILFNLTLALGKFLEVHPLGELRFAPLDVILSEHDVLEPDLLFVLKEHRTIVRDWVRGAPDLVVEILSPATEARDRGPKMKAYARFGVGEYWIVDPVAQVIEVYRLATEGFQLAKMCAKDDTVETPLLPGFLLPVGPVFQS
ncbi:MAG: Uma2 family endonuclease [Acidobacteriia bacterium]|nr:Uma2 family endonuclease [Terriglobia bacterium]